MESNLKLIVGEEKLEIMVSPQVMSQASPVFRQMLLANRFTEGQSISHDGFLDLILPDDSADAMRILCNIFHLKTNQIPRNTMTSNSMADLATLVDKYDCAAAIQPWPDIWKDQAGIQEEIAHPITFNNLAKWVHISAQLGYGDIFRQTTSALIAQADEEDLGRGSLLAYHRNLRPFLQEHLEGRREVGLRAFQSACLSLVHVLEKGSTCRRPHRGAEAAFNCSWFALSNAVLVFREMRGAAWRMDAWTGSVLHCRNQMLENAFKLDDCTLINCNDFSELSLDDPEHFACIMSPGFRISIDALYDNIVKGLELRDFGNLAYRIIQEM